MAAEIERQVREKAGVQGQGGIDLLDEDRSAGEEE
jgi:hypothetical protein